MKSLQAIAVVMALQVLVACDQGKHGTAPEVAGELEPSAATKSFSVYTVNYPLTYFAERLGGDRVDVTFPAPAGTDPAYWAPEPEVIAGYQRADLILLNGVDYAKWLSRASLPSGRLVNTSVGFENRWIPLEEGPVHTHGLAGEHSHKGYAFTTWLDPQLAVAQAETIASALGEALPDRESEIQEALHDLSAEWGVLDNELESIAAAIGDRPLIFSHPVYQYLVARYKINGKSLHWEPDEAPSSEQWQELESILEEHPARWMIWESEPLPEVEQQLAELGIQSAVFDPCSNVPEVGDLLSVMRGNVAELARAATDE